MPIKTGTLTPQEQAYAKAFAETGSSPRAAEIAGYSNPVTSGARVAARPGVAAEVARLQLERLTNEALPLAVDTHIAMLKNPRTPAGALVQAIKLAYDRALGVGASDAKEPHEMTAAELAAAIDALKRIASDKAKPIIDNPPQPEQRGLFD